MPDVTKQTISAPGIYFEIAPRDYFADCCAEPSLTQSLCKTLIEQSPLHARQTHPRLAHPVDGDDEDVGEKYDRSKAIGNAVHSIAIGRGKQMSIVDAPNFQTKLAKEAKKAAIEQGVEPILSKHYDVAKVMAGALWTQLEQITGCENAFNEDTGNGEVVAVAIEDGLYLRTMIDWLTDDMREVWDLKTSGMSASPYNTGKIMASAGWHVQCAMHERILDTLDPAGAGRRKYRYICQENEPPFALTVNEIGEAALTIGRKQIDFAIKTWRYCRASGIWPAYPLRIIRPELPAWAENGWINREIAEYEAEQGSFTRSKMLPSLAGG